MTSVLVASHLLRGNALYIATAHIDICIVCTGLPEIL